MELGDETLCWDLDWRFLRDKNSCTSVRVCSSKRAVYWQIIFFLRDSGSFVGIKAILIPSLHSAKNELRTDRKSSFGRGLRGQAKRAVRIRLPITQPPVDRRLGRRPFCFRFSRPRPKCRKLLHLSTAPSTTIGHTIISMSARYIHPS